MISDSKHEVFEPNCAVSHAAKPNFMQSYMMGASNGKKMGPTTMLGPKGNNGPGPSLKPACSPFVPQAASAMCIVCGVRPQYSHGLKSYPTCGLTCATKLKGSTNKGSGNSSAKMCVVCGVRPMYSKGGKSHSTCGLTCAATLKSPSGSGGMCDHCHQRPKFFDGRKTYPQCGRTCRDKSKLVASGGAGGGAMPVSPSGVSFGSSKYTIHSPSKATGVGAGIDTKTSRDKPVLSAPPYGSNVIQVMAMRNGKPVKLDEVYVNTGGTTHHLVSMTD